jgi:hypothetical protein
MHNEPNAVEGYVAYETTPDEPTLKAPHESEALAMSLLGAASEARAQQAREKAYSERNLAVAAFVTAFKRATEHTDRTARFGHTDPAEEYQNTADGRKWRLLWCEAEGHPQMTWHVPAEYVPEWCEEAAHTWDGHDTEEKNRRLAAFADVLAAVEQGGDPPSADPSDDLAES